MIPLFVEAPFLCITAIKSKVYLIPNIKSSNFVLVGFPCAECVVDPIISGRFSIGNLSFNVQTEVLLTKHTSVFLRAPYYYSIHPLRPIPYIKWPTLLLLRWLAFVFVCLFATSNRPNRPERPSINVLLFSVTTRPLVIPSVSMFP